MSENTKNASQRIEELEVNLSKLENTVNQLIGAIQPIQPMAQDLMGSKEALKLLNNKLDSVVRALNESQPLTEEVLSGYMTENNVTDLASKVKSMVDQGILESSDTVSKGSFVVINEMDSTGKVVNPRMQFLVSAIQSDEVKSKLDGAKVGDSIVLGDQGISINVLETYNVAAPKAPEAQASLDASSATTETEAPAAETEAPAAEAAAPAEQSATA